MNIKHLVLVAILMFASSMVKGQEGASTDEVVLQDGFESQQITTVVDDSENSVGIDSSIVIGTDNFPVISYWQYEEGGARLKVTRCGNSACDD